MGVGYLPESRDVFPTVTVRQNLELGIKDTRSPNRWSIGDMYNFFPRLKEREDTAAGVLSGGEQQMLTLCRTLMGDPDMMGHGSIVFHGNAEALASNHAMRKEWLEV
ncbi:ATP-binding cassette domain-containing protein [Allopusillimonas ginsengisoli]|nr:ATP-binding cassette domain-containing protein [Allopusillimonas ginsengisoli]